MQPVTQVVQGYRVPRYDSRQHPRRQPRGKKEDRCGAAVEAAACLPEELPPSAAEIEVLDQLYEEICRRMGVGNRSRLDLLV
ncbi:MAG: hypothetical protein HYY96_04755 [Candidatus Tectomicrobia bacterium]|nr:hypothetical protein [Candidatus Tectomicrobia bacterium]